MSNKRPTQNRQETVEYVVRAPRFPIETTVRFRESGETHWHEGMTANISRTGVLFRAKRELALQTLLEIRIIFPEEITGEMPMQVACWGPVVRKESPIPADRRLALAAMIQRYRFCHD